MSIIKKQSLGITIFLSIVVLILLSSLIGMNITSKEEDKFHVPSIKNLKEIYKNKIEAYEDELKGKRKEDNGTFKIIETKNEQQEQKLEPKKSYKKEQEQQINKNQQIRNQQKKEVNPSIYNEDKKNATGGISKELVYNKSQKEDIKEKEDKNERKKSIYDSKEKKDIEKQRRKAFFSASLEEKEILAELLEQQDVQVNKHVIFRAIRDFYHNNEYIPIGSLLYGKAQLKEDRILIKFYSIGLEQGYISFDKKAYDLDGIEGIALEGSPSSYSSNSSKSLELLEKVDFYPLRKLKDTLSQIGGVIRDVSSIDKYGGSIIIQSHHRIMIR